MLCMTLILSVVEDVPLKSEFALAELNPTILLVLFTVTLDSHILKMYDSLFAC